MNRMEEYEALLRELEQTPEALETTLDRAVARRTRNRKRLIRGMGATAACFAIFVLLVNYCAPVAYACSKVPGLRELAAAVTFSRSLKDAVENDYVQPIDLVETKNGITAEISYLIVDQKQVNVFYSLDSEIYEYLAADVNVLDTDRKRPDSVSWSTGGYGAENGELRDTSIDFVEGNVPGSLILQLRVFENGGEVEETAPEDSDDMTSDNFHSWAEPEILAEFEFLLEFDPEFTEVGRVIPVNQTLELDGQQITVENVEVYPSHVRIDLAEADSNTAWLRGLYFYIETDKGQRFDPGANGLTALGAEGSRSMLTYYAESTYFYDAEHLELVITGAKWLDKDGEKVYVNLQTGETGKLPEEISFHSAERGSNGWILSFRVDLAQGQAQTNNFGHRFFDDQGNAYEINTSSSTMAEMDGDGNVTVYLEIFPLKNFHGSEVWLTLNYSRYWTAQEKIGILIG